MDKIILNKQQISELVSQNRYPVGKNRFLSRCIDGRYPNEKNLPALAFPGGDVGELALILAAGNHFGFEVNREEIFKILVDLVGGEKFFHFHSDSHADSEIPAAGCGHWRQIQLDPSAYDLNKDDVEFIKEKLLILTTIVAKMSQLVVLHGDHQEAAVLLLEGNFGVYPRFVLPSEEEVEVFVYHKTLVDERNRALSNALLKNKAVKLYSGCDEEYLYQVLSEESETHLFETAKRLAKGLPIYSVVFKDDGRFELEEMGEI